MKGLASYRRCQHASTHLCYLNCWCIRTIKFKRHVINVPDEAVYLMHLQKRVASSSYSHCHDYHILPEKRALEACDAHLIVLGKCKSFQIISMQTLGCPIIQGFVFLLRLRFCYNFSPSCNHSRLLSFS